MNKRLWRCLGLIFYVLALISCGREPLYQNQGYVFGTLVDVSIYGETEPRARDLSNQVLQNFQGLHDRLHAWQADSDLDQLNQAFAQGQKPVPVSAELAAIITQATIFSRQSLGLFNPAIGGLIKQWGFQRDEFTAININAEAIAALVQTQPQMSDIVLKDDQAFSKNRAVKLDLGGYAKGYALDQAAAYLRSQGVKNALINIGGNIIALGQHGKKPWRVGIQHPRKPGPIATLDLADGWAIGTSGDYQRYFTVNGKRYCHIIDPRNGYPAQNTQAVTVLVPPGEHTGTLSDVASKPIFVAEPANRIAMAKRMGIDGFMVIDAHGKIFVSAALAKRVQWTEPNVALEKLQ
ncbi:MAG: FAD:protein FMN transferase [Methylophilaceae bacterium]